MFWATLLMAPIRAYVLFDPQPAIRMESTEREEKARITRMPTFMSFTWSEASKGMTIKDTRTGTKMSMGARK